MRGRVTSEGFRRPSLFRSRVRRRVGHGALIRVGELIVLVFPRAFFLLLLLARLFFASLFKIVVGFSWHFHRTREKDGRRDRGMGMGSDRRFFTGSRATIMGRVTRIEGLKARELVSPLDSTRRSLLFPVAVDLNRQSRPSWPLFVAVAFLSGPRGRGFRGMMLLNDGAVTR